MTDPNPDTWPQLLAHHAHTPLAELVDGFADIARAAATEARRRGADVDEATRANLRALGIAQSPADLA